MAISPRRRLAQFESEDSAYAKREYDVTGAELDAFVKRMDEELNRERVTGTVKSFTGDFEADMKD